MSTSSWSPARLAALAILAVAAATIGGALASQYVFGLIPCELCLLQRQPYYIGVPLAFVTLVAPARGPWLRLGLWSLATVFLVSACLGTYHAGVEWRFWPGPVGCSGGGGDAAASVDDFVKSLGRIQVVSCTDAAWRLFGISLAGWNALISLALTTLAVWGAARARWSPRTATASRPQGSSSVSQ